MAYGYDPNRFLDPVNEDYLCNICHGVFNNPRLCEAEEHYFCLSCIEGYLVHSQSCPKCQQHLTQKTLKHPHFFLPKILSQLRIKCDYNSRGCPIFTQLKMLDDHVSVCEYRPVTCGNCGQEVNKRDENYHKSFCLFDRSNIQDLKDIKMNQKEIKDMLTTMMMIMSERQEKFPVTLDMRGKAPQVVENSQGEDLMVVTNGYKEGHTSTNTCEHKMKNGETKINECQDDDVRMEVMKMKENILTSKQDCEGFKGVLNDLLARNATGIIIFSGGYGCKSETTSSNTVELYCIVERSSRIVQQLEQPLVSSALCVHDNRILAIGGVDDEGDSDKIKVLKMSRHVLQCAIFGKLPVKLFGHDVVVHEGNLYVIGGCNWHERRTLDEIYQIALTPPFTVELLTRMPEQRRHHRAELVNGKLFILGGASTGRSKDATDSVVVYDFGENEFKPCPSLPQPVSRMSSVTSGENIIVIGGMDMRGRAVNDVITYHTVTGRSEMLPSMQHKRYGSSVVIIDDVIFVFGGRNMRRDISTQWKPSPLVEMAGKNCQE
ncbi:uncharacterized protein LOC114538461 [Dendronephthya gigantea]|uniref:uncharacterized protein LOC114538461 n=1 Tax=Dendronephthya gigantea TaxID=151771 RepID=UPI00106B5A37|nr:uncharacterized protein LOC114538461 [Dendronephthya gigantea]